MNNIAYIGLGTNIGNKNNNLSKALYLLNNEKIKIKEKSKIYKTKAMYFKDQDDFLNMVIKVETCYSPFDILTFLQEIELKMGRERKIDKGPRIIDLDILYYNDVLIDLKNLQIPHIGNEERLFVLKPMMDVNPNLIDLRTGKTIDAMYKNLIKNF